MLWVDCFIYDFRSMQTFTKIALKWLWVVFYTGCHIFMVIWIKTGKGVEICTPIFWSWVHRFIHSIQSVQICTNLKCTHLYTHTSITTKVNDRLDEVVSILIHFWVRNINFFTSLSPLIPWLFILSYNRETLKEVAFLTCDYHNQYYITTTVNDCS